jgi:hypothetical protein
MILTSVRYQGTTITKIEGYTYFEHSYPDILLDIGNDGSVEWSSDGEIINETETEDFSSAINQFLVSCSTNSEGYCILPIKITSVTAGQLFVYGLDIKFETISYLWKTENIPSGLHYRVRIAAHDDFLSSESDESEDFTISHGGKPPLPYTLEGQQTD